METAPREGLLVSLEGISGCGKTYLSAKLHAALKEFPTTCVQEIAERRGDGLDLRIIALLHHSQDRFFRMGAPLTETFLLQALKMYDFEALIAPVLTQGSVVIEDRSLDTIAVYQALMLWPQQQERWLGTAQTLYEQAAHWRRPPDVTFLLEDDFDTALARAQQRSTRRFNVDEVTVLRHAAGLYEAYATCYQSRIVRIDRRVLSEEALLQRICQEILARWQHRGG